MYVYQKSTKKASNPLHCKGWRIFQFLGRLPAVYHINFLMLKEDVSWIFSRFLQSKNPRKGRDTGVAGLRGSKTSKFLGKT